MSQALRILPESLEAVEISESPKASRRLSLRSMAYQSVPFTDDDMLSERSDSSRFDDLVVSLNQSLSDVSLRTNDAPEFTCMGILSIFLMAIVLVLCIILIGWIATKILVFEVDNNPVQKYVR